MINQHFCVEENIAAFLILLTLNFFQKIDRSTCLKKEKKITLDLNEEFIQNKKTSIKKLNKNKKGFVYSMGSHRYGGLGLDKLEADVKFPTRITELTDIVDIAANTNVSYAINKKGKCFSWGTNYSKQLGQDTEDDYYVPTLIKSKNMDSRDVYQVSVGGQHSLFVVSEEKDEDESDTSIAT